MEEAALGAPSAIGAGKGHRRHLCPHGRPARRTCNTASLEPSAIGPWSETGISSLLITLKLSATYEGSMLDLFASKLHSKAHKCGDHCGEHWCQMELMRR